MKSLCGCPRPCSFQPKSSFRSQQKQCALLIQALDLLLRSYLFSPFGGSAGKKTRVLCELPQETKSAVLGKLSRETPGRTTFSRRAVEALSCLGSNPNTRVRSDAVLKILTTVSSRCSQYMKENAFWLSGTMYCKS